MTRLALICLALLLAACEGSIAGGASACKTPEPTVRRLTRAELDATLTSSLGTPVKISGQLAAEDSVLGYFAHDRLQVSTLFADQLDSVTTTLAKDSSVNATERMACTAGEAERDCARRYLKGFAEKTWRRPVTSEELDDLVGLYDVGRDGEDVPTALALAMQGVIESTGTLYRTELGDEQSAGKKYVKLTQWEIASELSYLATGGPPDDALNQAAADGQLSLPEKRVEHLRRLLASPAAVAQLNGFVEQWLGLTNMGAVQKNNVYFPKFNTTLRDTMAESARAFTSAVISSSSLKVSELFSADYTFANDSLAQFLGSTETPGTTLARLSMSPLPRRGLLTHPALLSVYAHNDDGSPVLRGKLVRTRLLCENIPPPPPNVVAAVTPVSPTATTRERAAVHAASESCNQCHKLMDPIGFGLEGFDGFGEARTMESNKAIDDSGDVVGSDVAGAFKGGVELATKLSASKQVGQCATKQVLRFAIGRHETANDACGVDLMGAKFEQSNGSLTAALEGLVESDGFVMRTVAQ